VRRFSDFSSLLISSARERQASEETLSDAVLASESAEVKELEA